MYLPSVLLEFSKADLLNDLERVNHAIPTIQKARLSAILYQRKL